MTSEDIRTVKLLVNNEDAKKKLDEVNARLKQAERNKTEAFSKGDAKGIQKANKEIDKCTKEIKKMQSGAAQVNKVLSNLGGAKPKELRETIKALNKELNSGNVERGSKEWKSLNAALSAANKELHSINQEAKAFKVSASGNTLADWGLKWAGLANVGRVLYRVFASLKESMRQYVEQFAAMAEAESEVYKYTNLGAKGTAELNKELSKIDTRTSREQLNSLAADAGRLGIQGKDDILGFVDAADKLKVALGSELGDDATKNIGKLAILFGDDKTKGLRGAMLATGSALVDLGKNSSASEGYIAEFTGRLAGAASQAHMTQAQVMGLGSVLDQAMVSGEKGATALQKVIVKLYQDPAKMAEAAGMDVKAFADLVKNDANEALLMLIETLSKKGGLDKLAPVFGDMQMSGAGVVQVLSALAGNLENIREQQALATQSFAEGTTVLEMFDKQNNTAQASIDKAKNKAHEYAVELGESLYPIYMKLLGVSNLTLSAVSQLVKYIVTHIRLITGLVAATTLYFAIANKVAIVEALRTAQTKALTVLQTAHTAASYLGAAAMAVLSGNITRATIAIKAMTTAIKVNPIGLLVSVLTTVIALVWDWVAATNAETDAMGGLGKQVDAVTAAKQKANESTAEEIYRIQKLHKMLLDNKLGYDAKRRALGELQKMVPGYQASLTKEGKLVEQNTAVIGDYIRQLRNKALAEAYYEKMVEAEKKIADATLRKRQKQTNIDMVNAEIDQHPDVYQQSTTTWATDKYGGFYEVYDGPSLQYIKKVNERTKHEKALAKAESDLKNAINERTNIEKQINSDSEIKSFFDSLIISGSNSLFPDIEEPDSSDGDGGSGGSSSVDKKAEQIRKRIKELEIDQRRAEASISASYVQGSVSYEEYQQQLFDIGQKYIREKISLYEKGDSAIADLEKQLADNEKAYRNKQNGWSLHQIDVDYNTELAMLKQQHIRMNTSEEEYQSQIDELTLKHLLQRKNFLADNNGDSEEYHKAEVALQEEEDKQKVAKEQRFVERVKQLREEYMQKPLVEQMNNELAILDQMHQKSLVDEEEYLRMKDFIHQKYEGNGGMINSQTSDDVNRLVSEKYQAIEGGGDSGFGLSPLAAAVANYANLKQAAKTAYEYLEQQRAKNAISEIEYSRQKQALDQQVYENFSAVAQSAYATASAAMSSYSSLSQAAVDAEVAKIEARYDKEIEAAGDNAKKTAALEKQKQTEVNALKKEELQKQTSIQIASAVAQSAMNAILAYQDALKLGPAGLTLAPIMAATALAAGAIQIATIRKQAEVQLAEFYYGGFTNGKDYHREAGIVHEGEFVANHNAVNNPNVLPVLQLIDRAQRNNTVGSLTAADVSRSVIAPMATSILAEKSYGSPSAIGDPGISNAIKRLNENIEEGISAFVILDGERGLDKQWNKYLKMKKRV